MKLDNDQLTCLKNILNARISEWVGYHAPDEADEDYALWQAKLQEVAAISSYQDVVDYLDDEEAVAEVLEDCGIVDN